MNELDANITVGDERAKKEKFNEYSKKVEEIWKKYKSGVSLEDISCLYKIPNVEEIRQLIIHFEDLLNRERRVRSKDIEKRRAALCEKYNFSRSTIEYILSGNKKIDIISEEQMREKLNSLYRDIKEEGKPLEYLKDEYGATDTVVYELEDMNKEEFEDFLEKISSIKYYMQKGGRITRIAANLNCGARLVSYVAKHICEATKNDKSTSKSNSDTSMIQTNSLETQRRAGGVELE